MSTATRERRDEEHGTPRDERTAVVTALRLGWSMADAYHHAQTADLTDGGNRPTVAPPKLSNLTELAGWHRLGMYLDGVDVALAQIAPLTPAGRTVPSTAAARRATGADRDPLLRALDDLNIDVLRWTMATNHRVGVAYRLGRSLADTVRRGDADRLPGRFGGRHLQIGRWLDELASVLPPYSAAVVRRSLAAWATAVGRATVGDPGEAGLADLARELRNQGDLWQDVLTGGLHPRDLLDEENWAVIARNVVIRDRKLVAQAARGIFWPVLAPLLVVLLAVVGVSAAAAAGSPTTRAAVALVGLGAGLTAIWRSISTPTLSVAAEVNRPLLDSELVVQMTARIDRPLAAARSAGRAGRQRRPTEDGSKYVGHDSRIDLP
ncbi:MULTISPECIES: hypothetical protein [Micromonospora]|uniref:hypothetical protein n=1 Tax=Micromonospora TaxID=1873 RepID=UPI0003EED23E|nr:MULTISPECIES: hypothetical protein [unclassified Micromonospora]EWM67186.1 PE-PGRS family protein [Micromonospora sp. M42]MCK1805790.1 hypothetical protein [Micromonospora sp. R42106]MCK1830398.1 hypothetical protein [Micromonospora sp. R42003]MCK1843659.1 hypothetical protein [Micromonospora sp. R42004]MCM1017732.1 hypothetical protein [Micromonospora sp. XM-20-01]